MDINEYYSDEIYKKRRIPSFLRVLLFIIVPLLVVFAYKQLINPIPSEATMAILLGIGIILAVITRSYITSPQQFLQAIIERIRWVVMHLLAAWYTVINICRALVTMIARTLFWFIALLIYLISPVDFLPDVFFPVGFIDDGILTIVFFRFISFTLGMELKQKAREALENGRIETPFP